MSDRMKFGVIKGIGLQDRSLAFSTTKAGAFAERIVAIDYGERGTTPIRIVNPSLFQKQAIKQIK